jgi:hypothetical protein
MSLTSPPRAAALPSKNGISAAVMPVAIRALRIIGVSSKYIMVCEILKSNNWLNDGV